VSIRDTKPRSENIESRRLRAMEVKDKRKKKNMEE